MEILIIKNGRTIHSVKNVRLLKKEMYETMSYGVLPFYIYSGMNHYLLKVVGEGGGGG